jgi:CheY-like chemotaxis protein
MTKGPNSSRGPGSAKGPMTIGFVVDDDALMQRALGNLFQSAGMEVFGSTTEMPQSKLPDVASFLVLDIRFPGLSSLDFQAEPTKANIHIPIIFVTGQGDDRQGHEGRSDRFPDQTVSRSGVAIERDRKPREADKIVARLGTNRMMLSLDLRSIFLLDSHYSASSLYPLLKDPL